MDSVRRDAPMTGASGISGKEAATASSGKRGGISNSKVATGTDKPAGSGGAISSTTGTPGAGMQAAVAGSGGAISSTTGGGIAGRGPAAGGWVAHDEIRKEFMAESAQLWNSYYRMVGQEFLARVDEEEADIIAKNLEDAQLLRDNARLLRNNSGAAAAAAVAKKQQ